MTNMGELDKTYDLIVVGAGTGGSTAARFAAKNGLSVCLIERKPREKVGNKICGDAVGTEIFDFLHINHPVNEELSCHIKGAKVDSPNLKKCIDLLDPKQAGYIVNRIEFGQRLLNEALDQGVDTFLDNTFALDLIYDKKNVSGVKLRLENGEKKEISARLVIDASGFYTPLRKTIDNQIIEKEIPSEDSILCYREIVSFPQNDLRIKDPEYITIILDKERAPGGYIWYFPRNEHSFNIGLGVFMNYKGKVKDLYQKNVFNEFVTVPNYKILSSGGGVVPVRRPLWSCADNGIIFVGDAACQVNPLHGGGIDPSMRGGFYAADVAQKAIETDDYSINTLWSYNVFVMTTFGAEFASLDLLRRVLQVLDNNELNFGLGQDLLTGNEILEISSTGNLNLSLFDMAIKAFKGISNPQLLLDLNYLRIRMKEISALYKKFPSDINDFQKWQQNVIQVYDKVEKMLIKSKK
jgi:digeranylgeranylglycerophospholipid reductase